MKGTIAKITRTIKNGMYTNKYTVYFTNGYHRDFTINGEMIDKHFDFIMKAKCTPFYKKDGRHTADIFTIA